MQIFGASVARGSRLAAGASSRSRAHLMERGDVYLVSLDPTVGHEQQGKRPVLVISPGKFNRLTRMPVVLPITTGGDFACTAGFAVSLGRRDSNDRRRALRSATGPRFAGARGQEVGNGPWAHHRRGPEQGRCAVRIGARLRN